MSGRRRLLVAWLGLAAAALLATYPTFVHPASTIAGGPGDPLLNATVLAWDADRVRHGFEHFWDAPFLFPHSNTLAYTEHLIGVAVFTTPIEWLTGNPVLTYNIAFIASYLLAGGGMFLLARHLWRRIDAALLAALAFALTPYRFAQLTHLHVLLNGWMPVALLGLHTYFETGRRRALVLFALAYVLMGLSNGYFLYFFLIPLGVLVGVELVRPRVARTRTLIDLAVTGGVVAAMVAPVAFVYYRLQRDLGFRRAPEEIAGLSAHLGDYLRIADGGTS